MSVRKRPADEVDEPQRAKIHRREAPQKANEEYQEQDEKQSVVDYPPEDQFKVEVTLRSASKAALNDPKPSGYWEEKLGRLGSAEDLSSGDEQNSQTEATQALFGAGTRSASQDALEGMPANAEEATRAAAAGQNEMNLDSSGSEETDDAYHVGEFGDDSTQGTDDSNRSEYDEFAEFKWLEEIEGFVTCPGGSSNDASPEQVGYCEGKLIRRSQMCATFYDDMEEPSRDTSMLAFELFDRYGRLKNEFKEHPIRKGSGVWNKELDSGDILLIEYLHIHKQYRHRGLGKKVVTAMLERTREKTQHFFAIAWPTLLNTREMRAEMDGKTDAENDAIFQHEQDISIRFFRSMGFRRIGSTHWFGLASDPNHPSQLLAARDDYNPIASHIHVPDSELELLQKNLAELEDIECVQMLEQAIQKTPATEQYWVSTDMHGNTLLHTAAVNLKSSSVDWIMNRDFGPHLLGIRNNEGDTPLEALLIKLELIRIQRKVNANLTAHISDRFEGYSKSTVSCVVRLRGLVLTEMTDVELLRVSAGCTCGQCISGFLSPRMCFALDREAGLRYGLLSDGLESYSGADWVEFNEDDLQYLPERVRDNLKTNKSMRQGFTNLCLYIATCIRDKMGPCEVNVLAALRDANEWPPATKSFLQRGGSIASVASMIFERAMNNDEWAGDGDLEELFGKEIAELPECRNDHEFGFVSGMCGYKRVSQILHVSITGEPIEVY
jgi:ribosomal protein S18 acetylase RimI-like enzyme